MKVLGAALGIAALALAPFARAQGMDEVRNYGNRHDDETPESPQNTALEIRIGRYIPNVDSEFQNARPYHDLFGDKNRYSIGFELDWQAIRIPYLGTFGPGIGLSYTKSTGHSLVSSDLQQGIITPSGETTSLTIFPMYVTAVLRADYPARQTPVPLVPYAKLGLGFAPWIASGGSGTSRDGSVAGTGFSYGPQFALGLMLLLDFMDQSAAKEMDTDVGVNNSYVFAEWFVSDVGLGNQMHVGTNTWVLGLTFEI